MRDVQNAKVAAVMINGAWYMIQPGTFRGDNYSLGGSGVPVKGFTFLNPDGLKFSGPLTSIQMFEETK